ncbi:MAG TPA: hypothetical protein VF908_12220 [Gemmatimonadaceae bacterium]
MLSNLGFVLAGAVGLAVVRRSAAFVDGRERVPWLVLFAHWRTRVCPLGVVLLAPLVLLGAASVGGYWTRTESLGRGDVRFYYLVQFYPLVAILLLLALYPPRYTHGADLIIALAWYVAAKGAESSDGAIYRALGFVSGHTLKHLLATVGALWLARMLLLRQPVAVQTTGTAA